jgi:hypothetical protein
MANANCVLDVTMEEVELHTDISSHISALSLELRKYRLMFKASNVLRLPFLCICSALSQLFFVFCFINVLPPSALREAPLSAHKT